MKALSGYHTGWIEITDNSENNDNEEEDEIKGDDWYQ